MLVLGCSALGHLGSRRLALSAAAPAPGFRINSLRCALSRATDSASPCNSGLTSVTSVIPLARGVTTVLL